MFEVKKEDNNILKFIFIEPFTSEDMKKVLGLIIEICKKEKQFSFYVDTRKANMPPFNAALILRQWMKDNKNLLKKYLICSAVIMTNNTVNIMVKNLLTGVFKIQTPTRPNKLFTDYDTGVEWVKNTTKDYELQNISVKDSF